MATLQEIKGRISSVKGTLKITSAMKLVAASKLHRAQQAIEAMRPYERQLQGIMDSLLRAGAKMPEVKKRVDDEENEGKTAPVAIVAIASNSSLCGGFNAQAIAKVKEVLARNPGAEVWSIGRKMAEAMRKAGFPSPENLNRLVEHSSYDASVSLAERLMEAFADGNYSKVILVYNHFVSTARQVPVAEEFLPGSDSGVGQNFSDHVSGDKTVSVGGVGQNFSDHFSGGKVLVHGAGDSFEDDYSEDYIVEPSPEALMELLRPKLLKLKFHAAILDSIASEHAARTIAMQTATDNGEDLLAELNLMYNKGRQQRITSEILDLAGGKVEE